MVSVARLAESSLFGADTPASCLDRYSTAAAPQHIPPGQRLTAVGASVELGGD